MKKVATYFVLLLCCFCIGVLSEGNASLLETDGKPLDRPDDRGLKAQYSTGAVIAQSQAFLKTIIGDKHQGSKHVEKEANKNAQNDVTVPIQVIAPQNPVAVDQLNGRVNDVERLEVGGEINVPIMPALIPVQQPQDAELLEVNGEVNAPIIAIEDPIKQVDAPIIAIEDPMNQVNELSQADMIDMMNGNHSSFVIPSFDSPTMMAVNPISSNDSIPYQWSEKIINRSFSHNLYELNSRSLHTVSQPYNVPVFSPGKRTDLMLPSSKEDATFIKKDSVKPTAQLFKSFSLNNTRHNDLTPGNVVFVRAVPQVRNDDNGDGSSFKDFLINLSFLFIIF